MNPGTTATFARRRAGLRRRTIREGDDMQSGLRRDLVRWTFEQEYLCIFVDPIDSYFRGEDISNALDHGVRTPD